MYIIFSNHYVCDPLIVDLAYGKFVTRPSIFSTLFSAHSKLIYFWVFFLKMRFCDLLIYFVRWILLVFDDSNRSFLQIIISNRCESRKIEVRLRNKICKFLIGFMIFQGGNGKVWKVRRVKCCAFNLIWERSGAATPFPRST